MLTSIKNRRSLTFYQHGPVGINHVNVGSVGAVAAVSLTEVAFGTAMTTGTYNSDFHSRLSRLNDFRVKDIQNYDLTVPNKNARDMGVTRKWMYEQADIEMGGSGSGNWTDAQIEEIRKYGKVNGAEGHHINNVADHPELQANPDNIKLYGTRAEHLKEGHNGDYRNESNGALFDNNKMLDNTNFRRVFRNEMLGISKAALIGAGIGFAIGFITSLARNGISPKTVMSAAVEGAERGVESSAMSVVGYGVSRITTTVTSNVLVSTAIVGVSTILLFSAYQFYKLKCSGVDTRDALLQVGKQAGFSLSVLAVSMAATNYFGLIVPPIVTGVIGIIMVTYIWMDYKQQREFADKVRAYTIEKCYPSFAV
ncbi:hypothetical protein [Phascolarctobacterium sp.]|uniref:hypothetical protein n=1 Tax=Phascolarctobacterium sp. TaxID=2049039 RepID=UPI00386428DD